MAKVTRKRKRQPQRPASRKVSRARREPASMDHKALRDHLLSLMGGGNAHLNFEKAVADFPFELCGLKPDGIPYSAWQILEHLRIAQWDILEFSRNPQHVSPEWPEGYWPSTDSPSRRSDWDESVQSFRRDLKAMQILVRNPRSDLFARIPHGDGQTILREAMLVADHNAYHLGQLVLIRRLLGTWAQD
jgi:hypothetical protein